MQQSWRAVLWCLLLAMVPMASSLASGLVVRIVDGKGQPVADTVVTLQPGPGAPVQKVARAPQTHVIDQKNLMFAPYLDVLRPGDAVVFRNSDRTRHHVYSFSPAKTFEFVLAPGQSSPPLLLDQAGVVAVGCNIHDQMAAYLYVTDATLLARSGADGRAVFDALPAGRYDVQAWHPRLRPGRPGNTRATADVGATPASLVMALSLLPDMRQQMAHEHMQY
jgi:plastocyanin